VKAFLLRVDQKRIGVSLNRRVKIELAKTDHPVSEALEDEIAVSTPVIPGKHILDAAQINSTAAGCAHKDK
jgi:hypothetical protein